MVASESSFAELRAMATAALGAVSADRLQEMCSELDGGVLPEELRPYASKGPLTITTKGFLDLVQAELAQRGPAPQAPPSRPTPQEPARPSLLGWLRRLLGLER